MTVLHSPGPWHDAVAEAYRRGIEISPRSIEERMQKKFGISAETAVMIYLRCTQPQDVELPKARKVAP